MQALIFIFAIKLLSFHPYYVSIFEVNHNPDTKTVQVAARIFIDDLENVLMDEGREKPYIGTERELSEADELIADYLNRHFMLTADGERIELDFIGKESETDVIWCYLESNPIDRIDTLHVKADLLIDMFPLQNNLVHTEERGIKKSVILKKGKIEDEIVYGS